MTNRAVDVVNKREGSTLCHLHEIATERRKDAHQIYSCQRKVRCYRRCNMCITKKGRKICACKSNKHMSRTL